MKKNLFYAVVAIGMLASCVDNEYVGEVTPNPNPGNGTESAIVFSSGTKTITRADHEGADAANLLNNKFVFAGTKGVPTGDPAVIDNYVFDQYTAKYVEHTANSTQSNSSDWEYVNQPLAPTSSLASDATQTIKYWDYATSQYDFAAYSTYNKTILKEGTLESGKILATAIDVTSKSYTLTGSAEDLKECYISDLVTAYNRNGVSDYGEVVTFKFRSLAAKIRIALYETVPGYSVGDVLFYESESATTPSTTPTLFASSTVLPSGSGTMTVTFPTTGWDNRNATDYNKAHVEFAQASGTTGASTLTFDALDDYANPESKEVKATSGSGVPTTGFLGRSSKDATYAGGLVNADNDESTPETGKYYTILPNEDGANLTLRIKYTLLSTDGSKESITVDNATAVIPAELAKWSPNYAYTYIFKISDMTNGTTGINQETGEPTMGLTPITLNAVVVDSEDGIQETITTVSKPSITTYAKGKVVTVNDEYVASVPIYVIVNDGEQNVTLSADNAKLYTATTSNAIQGITEETVDNALRNGTVSTTTNTGDTHTVADAGGGTLAVTDITPSDWLVKEIAATDSPTGNKINMDGTNTKAAKFTPVAGTNYVFQYLVSAAVTTYTAETAAAYNATLPGAVKDDDVVYSFVSYGTETNTEYGTGKVKVVETGSNYTIVEVIENQISGFVGNRYKVNATSLDNVTLLELFNLDGSATGISVKDIASYSYTADEAKTHNAALTGAAAAGGNLPSAIPAKYQYKIIKVQ